MARLLYIPDSGMDHPPTIKLKGDCHVLYRPFQHQISGTPEPSWPECYRFFDRQIETFFRLRCPVFSSPDRFRDQLRRIRAVPKRRTVRPESGWPAAGSGTVVRAPIGAEHESADIQTEHASLGTEYEPIDLQTEPRAEHLPFGTHARGTECESIDLPAKLYAQHVASGIHAVDAEHVSTDDQTEFYTELCSTDDQAGIDARLLSNT